jgi:hypothetical protein
MTINTKHDDDALEAVKTCTIVAPSTLAEGYTFSANVDGIDFTVIVPKGGVTEGQHFEVPYPAKSTPVAMTMTGGAPPATPSDPNPAITGRWRNDLCTCFDVCGSGMFWQAFCCTPLLLGQLMQRRKLNACGEPSNPDTYKNTFTIGGRLGTIVDFVDRLDRWKCR